MMVVITQYLIPMLVANLFCTGICVWCLATVRSAARRFRPPVREEFLRRAAPYVVFICLVLLLNLVLSVLSVREWHLLLMGG